MTGSWSNIFSFAAIGAPRATTRGTPDLRVVPPRVAEVLRAIAEGFEKSRWSVRRMTDGSQARLFSVRTRDARMDPENGGGGRGDELVVKLYRGDTPEHREAAREEFECLYRLHARLDGVTLRGWTIRCPRPVYRSDTSAALVMTHVPGQTLSWHLAQHKGPTAELVDSISRATVAALRHYWAGEPRLYGDLILNNILCDLESRTLSLVDPGMPERFYLCESVPGSWCPASRDLGFLLFWTASLIRRSIVHPILHARQKRMALSIVWTFLDGLGSPIERDDVTAEIEACARLHLARITTSASPRGLWRGIVNRAAARTIGQFFDELRATLPARPPARDGMANVR